MKKILLFLLLTLPVLLYAQYPTTGNKQRLGWQTTGDGLVYRAAGLPSYTPTTLNNAYTYIDTSTGRVYRYSNGAWRDLSSEKYIRKIDETILASPVKDSLSIHDWFFIAMELTSGATSDKAVQLPVTGLDSTYAGRIVRVSALDSSATYNVSVVSSSPDGIAIGDSLTTSYTLQNGETAELQLYVFDTIYQWRITFRRSFELPADNVTGNGTTNFLPLWIAPYTLGTAGISDDGSEIQFARPTVLYGVNTAAPGTFGAFGMNNLGGVYRPTYYNDVGSWINLIGGNLTQNYFGKADSKGNLVNANLTDNGTILDALLPIRLKSYTTVGLPTGAQGYTLYNTTFNQPQYHDGTSYRPFGEWVRSGSNIYFNTGNVYVGTNSPISAATLAIYKNSTSGADRLLVVNNATAYPDHSVLEVYANRLISFGNLGRPSTLYYNVSTSEFNAPVVGFKIRQASFPDTGVYGITYTNTFGFNGGGVINTSAPLASDAANEFRAYSATLSTYHLNTSTAKQGGFSVFFNLNPGSGYYTAAGDMYGFQVGTEANSGFRANNTNAKYYSYATFQRIEQIGTSTGITRGFWANDNIISAHDYRAFEANNNIGTQLYLSGTAPIYVNPLAVTQNDTISRLLVINPTTGFVRYRNASSLSNSGFTPIARTIYDGDAALPDSTVAVNGTFNAGFWRVPESMDGYTLTKASFGIFDKGDLATSGATYSFGVQKCNGSNMSCSNSSNVNFTPSSETELELTLSITLNANDILRVNYQPPQGCGTGCGTENVNGLVVTYTIRAN